MTPPDHIAALALHDCGPSGPGAPVRDHLPVPLSADARDFILTRLNAGEVEHGAPLAMGWERALLELTQELADAIAYAVAAGMPQGFILDLCASLDTALRRLRSATGA